MSGTWQDPVNLGENEGESAWWEWHMARVTLWRDLAYAHSKGAGYVPTPTNYSERRLLLFASNGTRPGATEREEPWLWWCGARGERGQGAADKAGPPESFVRRFAGRLRLVGTEDGPAQIWVASNLERVWSALEVDTALGRYVNSARSRGYCTWKGVCTGDLAGELALATMDALETFRPQGNEPLHRQWGKYHAVVVNLVRTNYMAKQRPTAALEGNQSDIYGGSGTRVVHRDKVSAVRASLGVPRGHGIVPGDYMAGETPKRADRWNEWVAARKAGKRVGR